MFDSVKSSLHTARVKILGGIGDIVSDVGPLSFFSNWFNPNNLVGELEQLEKYTGIVYACISAIAEDVARIQITVNKQNKDGTLAPIVTHPFLDMIKRPNQAQSDYELFEMTQTHIELTGEAFWYLPKGAITGQPKEIYIMRPDLVEIVYNQDTGEVSGYVYHKYNGRVQIPLDLDEVVHFKMPNPVNPYRGMGTVQAGMIYIQTEEFASRFSRNFLANNATPAGIVNFKGTIPDPEFQKIKRQWTQEYGNVNNAGKTAFLRNVDASYEKIGSSLQDIDLTALKNLTRDDIMFMFRVSKPVLGITEDVNYASAKTAEYIFAKRVVDPKMNRLVDILQTFYNLKFTDGNVLSYKSPIPQDNDEKIAYLETMVTTGIISRNEARAIEGLKKTPGGDTILVPFNLIPLAVADSPVNTDTGNASDTTPAAPSDDDSGSDSGSGSGTDEDDEDDDSQKSFTRKKIRLVLRSNKKKAVAKKANKPAALSDTGSEAYRDMVMRTADAYVPQLEHVVQQAVAKQRLKVHEELKQFKKKQAKIRKKDDDDGSDDSSFSADDIDYGVELAAGDMVLNLMPILTEAMQQSGQIATEATGATAEQATKYVLSQTSIDRIKARVEHVAEDYSDQTKQALYDAIANTIENDGTVADMTKAVDGIFDKATGWRAERLARTEAVHEANYAALDAYQQSGLVIKKEWYANPDACEYCLAMNGQVMDLETAFVSKGSSVDGVDGGVFSVDYEDVEAGDLHPNCRCTILPVRGDL